jgi:hypothetical protein
MQRRYWIYYNNTERQVFPFGVDKLKLEETLEQDQIFKRKKLQGKLQFINNTKSSITDFDFFAQIELARFSCEEIKFRIERNCGNTWSNEWFGYFSTGAGSFDFDKCIFEVQAEPNDIYRCIFDNWEKEFNIFDYEVKNYNDLTGIGYELLVANTFPSSQCSNWIPCSGATTAYGWYAPDYVSAQNMIDNGWCVKEHVVTPAGDVMRIGLINTAIATGLYTSFAIGDIVDYDSGSYGPTAEVCDTDFDVTHNIFYIYLTNLDPGFNPLVGDILNNNGAPLGNPNNAAGDPFATAVGEITSIDFVEYCTVSTTWQSYVLQRACVSGFCDPQPGWTTLENNCGSTGFCTFRACVDLIDLPFYRGVLYNDLVNSIVTSLCGEVEQMTSIFLDYNPDVTDPHYSTGINYITGAANRVSNLMVSQKSDIVDSAASNPATIGILTLKTLLTWAREVFQVYWDVKLVAGAISLQMEHYDFFERSESIDLTDAAYAKYVKGLNKYEHTKSKIPSIETFTWVDAGGIDFIGKNITYGVPCATPDQTESHDVDLSTDIGFIANNDRLDLEGFVLAATDYTGTEYNLNSEAGLITGNIFSNAHLSWANLHYNYFRHNRYLQKGAMNDIPTTFISWRPNIEQVKIEIPDCCNSIDAEGYATTELGQKYLSGAKGVIDKISISFTNKITLSLKYSI